MPSEESSITALEYDMGALSYDLEELREASAYDQARITRLENALALLVAAPGCSNNSARRCREALEGPIE